MAGERHYTPIYRDIMEEHDIFDDDRVCVAWFRLRLAADVAWPEPAMLPRSAPDDVVAVLADLGKIELIGRDLFRFRGVDMDRTRKSDAGRAAAEARWRAHAPAMHPQSTRIAHALPEQSGRNADPMPKETETEKETRVNKASIEVPARALRRPVNPVETA